MDPHLRYDSNILEWLYEKESIGIRYLALRDLANLEETDPEFTEARASAHEKGPIAEILSNMQTDGYWVKPGPGYNPKYFSTVWSLILLAQLGAVSNLDSRIALACNYVLDHALAKGGQFSIDGVPSGTVDCLQGNLCWALLELGVEDPRLENAFDWMARSVTGEGIASISSKNAPQRYYAGKCGPNFACGANNKLPCAWGAAKVMLAFSRLPKERYTTSIQHAIQHGIEFLFSVDPAQANWPSGWSERPSRNWWKFGFPIFYVTDLLQILEILVNLGYGEDPRLNNALDIVVEKQDNQSRWALEYEYNGKTWITFGIKKQPNKWVTLRSLKVLSRL